MSTFSEEKRAAEEAKFRGLAEQLRGVAAPMAASSSGQGIVHIAQEADGLANKIRDAATLEEAEKLAEKGERDKARWMEMLELLMLKKQVEEEEDKALLDADAKLQAMATQLRAVSSTGSTAVFSGIGAVAEKAEAALQEFRAAPTNEAKWAAYAKSEESKTEWLTQMTTLQTGVKERQAAEEAEEAAGRPPPPLGGDESGGLKQAVQACYAMEMPDDGCVSSLGGFEQLSCIPMPSASCEAAPAPSGASPDAAPAPAPALAPAPEQALEEAPPQTPEEAKARVITYLMEEDGLMNTLRTAVGNVLKDERFEGVHADAAKMLEQMELAIFAVVPLTEGAAPEVFSDDVAGAEDRLRATVEPMRRAQWGGFYAKQAAWQVRKFDLYKRKGKEPKIAEDHADLLECATAITQLGEYLRKQAQGAVMDSVTGLMSQAMATGHAGAVV